MNRAFESTRKPRVGITLGDPAGIGPEIVLKSVADAEVRESCLPVIVGNRNELATQAERLGLPNSYPLVTNADELAEARAYPIVFDTSGAPGPIVPGQLSAAAGSQAIAAVETAVSLCLGGDLDAIVTAPVNKEALKLAGSPHPGHTEMLSALCGGAPPLMCFFAGDLRVFLLTVHTSLSEAIAAITSSKVVESVVLAHRELQRFGAREPRIAVAGLNPHAGEHGLFGNEELREIEPAIEQCRREHRIDVSGPYPADTIFVRAWRGEFDAVAACYHDQGLIAVKCLAFGKAVNVTLGLPIIRTSVDHGTAFDIAGRGVADHSSMIEAIKRAAWLVQHQQTNTGTKETTR